MKQIISALLLITIVTAGNAQKPDPRFTGMDKMINQVLKEWNVPGVSITVVEKNKVLFTGGFGYRDYENKQPVTENTKFAIGSCTKAFTASLIGYLIKDFNLDLDAPVNKYFPELKFYNNELTTNVTVRDMLCHRTGLPRHDYAWYSGGMGNRDSMVKLIRYLEPNAPLRQTFQYNNLNYVALARLLEKNYQRNWEQLIEERLFAPLAMKSSTTGVLSNAADYSFGYIYKNGKVQKLDFLPVNLSAIAPAGGITSTAKDMANWLLMWTNQGKFEGKEIISADFYKQAISSQMIASANLPSKFMPDYYFFNYGLGWYTTNYRGHYGVGHSGNINGFSSFVSFLPTDSIGVFVSVNQNNSQVPRILTNIIVDKMIGAAFRDWNAILKQQGTNTVVGENTSAQGANPSHPMAAFTGIYKNEAYGNISIKEDKNGLSGVFNRWSLKIKHLHHNYFKFKIDADVFDETDAFEGEFAITAKGDISLLKIPFESGVREIEFKKQNALKSNQEEFKQYVGEYNFSGMTAKIYLTEANVLKALVPGQPEYELVPVRPDEFDVKGAKGVSIIFERDEKGNVPACLFVQPNGKFRVTRISRSSYNDR
ncbi:MAG: serine hydrolase [Bacteroidetes bacterium]|nr:serine hydrolase [Bacteroidota bacterium]